MEFIELIPYFQMILMINYFLYKMIFLAKRTPLDVFDCNQQHDHLTLHWKVFSDNFSENMMDTYLKSVKRFLYSKNHMCDVSWIILWSNGRTNKNDMLYIKVYIKFKRFFLNIILSQKLIQSLFVSAQVLIEILLRSWKIKK